MWHASRALGVGTHPTPCRARPPRAQRGKCGRTLHAGEKPAQGTRRTRQAATPNRRRLEWQLGESAAALSPHGSALRPPSGAPIWVSTRIGNAWYNGDSLGQQASSQCRAAISNQGRLEWQLDESAAAPPPHRAPPGRKKRTVHTPHDQTAASNKRNVRAAVRRASAHRTSARVTSQVGREVAAALPTPARKPEWGTQSALEAKPPPQAGEGSSGSSAESAAALPRGPAPRPPSGAPSRSPPGSKKRLVHTPHDQTAASNKRNVRAAVRGANGQRVAACLTSKVGREVAAALATPARKPEWGTPSALEAKPPPQAKEGSRGSRARAAPQPHNTAEAASRALPPRSFVSIKVRAKSSSSSRTALQTSQSR